MGYHLGLSHFSDFFSDQNSPHLKAEIETSLAHHHEWLGEVLIQDKLQDIQVAFSLRVFVIFDDKNIPKSLAIVATNIQERK